MEPKILVYKGRIYQKIAVCFFVRGVVHISLLDETGNEYRKVLKSNKGE